MDFGNVFSVVMVILGSVVVVASVMGVYASVSLGSSACSVQAGWS